jgi:hypothetical protein
MVSCINYYETSNYWMINIDMGGFWTC